MTNAPLPGLISINFSFSSFESADLTVPLETLNFSANSLSAGSFSETNISPLIIPLLNSDAIFSAPYL